MAKEMSPGTEILLLVEKMEELRKEVKRLAGPMRFAPGGSYVVRPGDHFNLLLPDGTMLNVEQTADDFSIVRGNGNVAYTKPTSEVAIKIDGEDRKTGENPTPPHQTTGFN